MFNRTSSVRSKMRTRLVTGVAVLGISASALVVAAVPAEARPRSCANIYQSMRAFALLMDRDTGVNAKYLAGDTYLYNYNGALYDKAGC